MRDDVQIGPTPGLAMALLPLLATTAILILQFFIFSDFTPHIPLAFGIMICAICGRIRGVPWEKMEASMLEVVKLGMPAIFILLAVGMVIGTWILSGTVPTLMYYGFQLVSPSYFLVATCVISALVSLATGTSWGTVGTLGLALMGIGEGLGIPMHLTGGALVSGAFFGDKMSPLSETTNLTPAVCETDLWSHIRSMMATTVPAMLIALVLYVWLGADYGGQFERSTDIATFRQALDDTFTLSWITLIPPCVVIALALAKFPPFPTIFTGAAIGGLVAIGVQGETLHAVFDAMQNGFSSDTGNPAIDALLSSGGVLSMTWVVTLTFFALGFAGMLEAYGTVDAIIKQLMRLIKGRFSLVATSSGTTLAVSTIIGDVYTTLVLPGRLLKGQYQAMGYKTCTLSRSIEDNGTLSSPLIPWNMGGGFVSSTIGVPTLAYAPFAFACWLSPLFGLLWALTGRFIPRDTLRNTPEQPETNATNAPHSIPSSQQPTS